MRPSLPSRRRAARPDDGLRSQTTTSASTTLRPPLRTSSSRPTACPTPAPPSRATPSTRRRSQAVLEGPRASTSPCALSSPSRPRALTLCPSALPARRKTATSRRRAALKRAAGKKGTVYEEMYLLNSMKKAAEVKLAELQSASRCSLSLSHPPLTLTAAA